MALKWSYRDKIKVTYEDTENYAFKANLNFKGCNAYYLISSSEIRSKYCTDMRKVGFINKIMIKKYLNYATSVATKIWNNYNQTIFFVTIVLMLAVALKRTIYEFNRLLFQTNIRGAIDLKLRYDEVQAWFSGKPVYSEINSAVYPPASYTMLFPFLNYPSFTLVRWVWLVIILFSLASLIYVFIQEIQTKNIVKRGFLAIMIISMYATGVTIGNGQITTLILGAIVAGFFLINKSQGKLGLELLAGGLIILSLMKPTISLPFMWLLLFPRINFRLIFIIAGGYLVLALIATFFQHGNLIDLHQQWLSQGIDGATWSSTGGGGDTGEGIGGVGGSIGYGNLHSWLGALGLSQWNFLGSMIMLFVTGIWVYFYRTVNFWILLGVIAIISRLWTYHLIYDDMLLLIPMFTLFYLTNQESSSQNSKINKFLSGIFLAIAIVASLVPPKFISNAPWDKFFKIGQTSIWILILIFLLSQAWWYQKQNISAQVT